MVAVDRVLGAVDVLDEIDQAARVVERTAFDLMRRSGFGDFFFRGFWGFGGVADDFVDYLFPGDPFVGQVDGQTLVQERHLLQPAGRRSRSRSSSSRKCPGPPRIGPSSRSSWSCHPCLRVPGTERS